MYAKHTCLNRHTYIKIICDCIDMHACPSRCIGANKSARIILYFTEGPLMLLYFTECLKQLRA